MSFQLLPYFPRKTSKEIIQFPDPRLKKSSQKVKTIDKETKEIAEKLIAVLKEIDTQFNLWLGMAAPQIGDNKRIIILKRSYKKYTIMINPEILEKKWNLPVITGCYSLKGLYLYKSYYYLKVRYQHLNGDIQTETIKGYQAIILRQEIDHLDGKLVCD